MKAEYVNAFLEPALEILKESTKIEVTVGKVFVREKPTSFQKSVIIGISGDLKGVVIMSFSNETAASVASSMLNVNSVTEDLTESALCELANMMLPRQPTE